MSGATFKIDKGVPVPTDHVGRPAKYPWAEMKIRDSFFVPGANTNAMTTSAGHQRRTRGTCWTVEARTEDGIPGVRVWRVA